MRLRLLGTFFIELALKSGQVSCVKTDIVYLHTFTYLYIIQVRRSTYECRKSENREYALNSTHFSKILVHL